jgi:glycosyltransferase involved in cell wall biosynthesis
VIDLLGNAVNTAGESGTFKICERGISVQPGDASGFASGLTRLIDDEHLRRTTGETGRLFIEQQYAKERLLADIGALYQELLKRAPVVVNVRQTSVCR